MHDGEQRGRAEYGKRRAAGAEGVVDEAPEEGLLGNGCQRAEGDDPNGQGLRRVPAPDHTPEHECGDPHRQHGKCLGPRGAHTGRRIPGPGQAGHEEQGEERRQGRRRVGAVAEQDWPQGEKRAAGRARHHRCSRPRQNQVVHRASLTAR